MARQYNGGTESLHWTISVAQPQVGSISFKIKTTQTVVNVVPLSYWSGTSRNGWGFVLNGGGAGHIAFLGYTGTTQRLNVGVLAGLHDGNDHTVTVCYGRGAGNVCQVYIDGALAASGAATAAWGSGATHFWLQTGDQVDAFWPTFIGEIWDIAFWNHAGAVLSADDAAALSKGISPRLIRPSELIFYAPLVRSSHDLKGNVVNTETALTVSPHGKRLGPGI